MTSTQQRKELQLQIWQIANEVRGLVDGWDFKQYVLGTLFYRFISENFTNYIEGGNAVVDKNTRLSAVLKGVNRLKLDKFQDGDIDVFGDAYEFLISNYAANAGKSGGEFFTPTSVSKLINDEKNNHIAQIMNAFDSKEDVEYAELKKTVKNINKLRNKVDKIVAEIEL